MPPESQRVAVGTNFGLEAIVVVGEPAPPKDDGQVWRARKDALVRAIGILGVELAKLGAEPVKPEGKPAPTDGGSDNG